MKSIRTFFCVTFAGALLFTTACGGPQAEYRTTSTLAEVMDGMVMPNADYVWKAVSTVSSAKGIVENAPHTADEWETMREHAVTLMEASDLIQIPGRLVDKAGVQSKNPKIELSPEVIKTMIDSDRASWIKHSHALHDAVAQMIKAIDGKNTEAVTAAGEVIDNACESCHKQYWYPESEQKK